MKKDPVTTFLNVVLGLGAISLTGLCYLELNYTSEARQLQPAMAQITTSRNFLGAMVGELVEYGKRNPAINPLLATVLNKPGTNPAAAAPPAATPKPQTPNR